MIDEARFQAMLVKARKTDKERTALEHQSGLASPSETGLSGLVCTARDALECAIKTEDWQIAAEALVFIMDAVEFVRVPQPTIGPEKSLAGHAIASTFAIPLKKKN